MNTNKLFFHVPILPQPVKYILKNGYTIYIYKSNNSSNLIDCHFSFNLNGENNYKALLIANILLEGRAVKNNRHSIADYLSYYGVQYKIDIKEEAISFSFVLLKKFFDRIILCFNTLFAEYDFTSLTDENISSFVERNNGLEMMYQSEYSNISKELFLDMLYGRANQNYDSPHFNIDDIKAFYKKVFVSNNNFLLVGGGINEIEINVLESICASLLYFKEDIVEHNFNSMTQAKFIYHQLHGVQQASIRIGRILFPISHKDYTTSCMIGYILAGYFNSRLIVKLRINAGFTYGVNAGMVSFKKSGYFSIATDVNSVNVVNTIKIIKKELISLTKTKINNDELYNVKSGMIADFLRMLNKSYGIIDYYITCFQYGLDIDYLNSYTEDILSKTNGDILNVAQKYFDFENMSIAILGNNVTLY